jgi:hypothetical protein
MTGKKNGNNNNNNKSNKTRSSSPNNEQQQRPAKKQFIELSQPTEASSSKDTSKNVASSDMELDTTARPLSDKGKAPETSSSSPKAPIDIDQAFDATENGLDNDKNKASGIHLERETEAPIYFAYCAAERFFPAKTNREKQNEACDIFASHYASFIGASVRTHPDDPNKKIVRIGFTSCDEANHAVTLKIPCLDNDTFIPLITKPAAKYIPELAIRVTEIPISTTESNLRSTFSFFGKITKCTMSTKNLWQQATITFEENTDMTTLNKLNSYFVLKDLVRVHPCTMSNEDVRKKSQFSLKLTNLPLDTNGRHLISIGNAIDAIAWVIPKSRANYRNLQYAIFYFKDKVTMDVAKTGDSFYLDRKR